MVFVFLARSFEEGDGDCEGEAHRFPRLVLCSGLSKISPSKQKKILFIYLMVAGQWACSVSDQDPLHLTGSGSTSGNVDPDPVSKKKCDKLT